MRAPTFAVSATFLCLLIAARSSQCQNLSGTRTDNSQQKESATQPAKPVADPQASTQVLYSGRLMGYFRVPDFQPRNRDESCGRGAKPSDEAKQFFQQRVEYPAAILVGTGDNFAPNMEARTFADPNPSHGKQYQPLNKEYYQWDPLNKRWLTPEEYDSNTTLKEDVAAGHGTIGTDNVGCFLRAAGYAAVVPGKHDFYFGPERLRELARFLASPPASPRPDQGPADAPKGFSKLTYRPVQMLAANLVIKTSWIEPRPAQSKAGNDKTKSPHFHFPDEVTVQNLKDGAMVYPWFSSVRLRLKGLAPNSLLLLEMRKEGSLNRRHESMTYDQFRTFIESESFDAVSSLPNYRKELRELRDDVVESLSDSIYLCLGERTKTSRGDPSAIQPPDEKDSRCSPLAKEVRIVGNEVVVDLPLGAEPELAPGKDGHFAVEPGENYGLWLVRERDGETPKRKVDNTRASANPAAKEQPASRSKENYCLRFSVHVPFLSHPSQVATGAGTKPKTYTDPDPYVYIADKNVAIFGVVDTDLGEHVGLLNFAWRNSGNKNVKTVVSVEDPADALRQQLEYFERRHKGFNGIKILLAQMTPPRARVLAARVPGFQVVVSAADQEQYTVGPLTDSIWTAPLAAVAKPEAEELGSTPTFFGVPSPFFNPAKDERSVDLGFIELAPQSKSTWKLTSKGLGPAPVSEGNNTALKFWEQVVSEFHNCEAFGGTRPASDAERLRLFTLCAMQQKTGADVALIQKRDLFPVLPDNNEDAPDDAQKILDRIIWKSDFLTVLSVPGSSLVKAMELSKKFEEDESASLSLVSETGRGLYTLGIRYDPDNKQYLINEVPVDPAKAYTVATTDYIGAGDTGYPALTADAISPPTDPGRFPIKLDPISKVVCQKLYLKQADKYCFPDLNRDQYLDASAQPPPYLGKSKSFWSRIFSSSARESNQGMEESVNQKVEQRPLWERDVHFTISFNALTNNLSDSEIDKRFSGVPTSSVTAHATRTLALELQGKFSHSLHKQEFFLNPAMSYNVQHTGFSDKIEQVNQISNLTTLDSGLRFKWRDRALPHSEGVLSVHLETPTASPITTFALSTPNGDRLQFTQGRGLTFLPRIGLRWQSANGAIELGGQGGAEFYALRGYQFKTNGVVTAECFASAATTFAQCVKDKSKPEVGDITPDSDPSTIRGHKPRAGGYWKMNFEVPLSSRLKYTLDDDGDFFLANFSAENATDTRFRYFSRHSLKVAVWPSLSFGPAYRLFLFQNKVNKDFLLQQQFLFEMDLGFDVLNWKGRSRQIRYRSSAPKH